METIPLSDSLPETPLLPPSRRRSTFLPIIILVLAGIVFGILWLRPVERSIEFEDFRLVYSFPWLLSDTANWSSCETEGIWDCDAALSSKYTDALITRFTIELSANKAEDLEITSRDAWLEANETARFIRVEELTIGGQPAVARVLSGIANSSSNGGYSGYGMQIFVLNGTWLYKIDVVSISEAHFEQDRALIMALLGGFEFRQRIIEGNTQT